MCYEQIPCPDCSSLNIVKNGKTAQQKQRYLCKQNRRQFIRDYPYLGCVGAIREMIVPLTLNGSGVRDIERLLLVSRDTVLKTLRAAAEQMAQPLAPKRVHALELDECWSFVRTKKQQRWTWYGFDRAWRQVVAYVNERRTDAACQKMLKKLEGCQVGHYYTDDWQSYSKFLPAVQHRVGKDGTQHIERHNLNFRTHLKRLQRRTICYSKLPQMHHAVIKLYIHHSNAGHHHL